MEDKIPEVSLIERRKFIRHPLCFPLAYKVVGRENGMSAKGERATSLNISIGGLLFAARRPVEMGAKVEIKMPFQNKVFNVRAKTVYCKMNPETKLYNIGVSFYKMSDAFKVKLIEQLYLISEFRDLRSVQLGKDISLEDASKQWIRRYSDRFRRLYW